MTADAGLFPSLVKEGRPVRGRVVRLGRAKQLWQEEGISKH